MVPSRTPVVSALTLLAVAVVVGPSGAASTTPTTPSPATTELASGVLTGADGRPSAGVVQLTAWPVEARREGMPLVAAATADARGRFRVATTDMERLRGLASTSQGGRLDFIAEGTTADGHAGTWVFSRFIRRGSSATARAAGASAATRAFAEPTDDRGAEPVRIAAKAAAPIQVRAAVARSLAFRPGTAASSVPIQPIDECTSNDGSAEKTIRPTPIGELNNAYRDTQAIFRYGRKADTEVSVGTSTGDGPVRLDGEVRINNEVGQTLTRKANKYAATLFSNFEYEKVVRTSGCTGGRKTIVRATRWIGSLGSKPLNGTLRVCNTRNRLTNVYRGRDEFKRDATSARSFRKGVNVFDFGLDVRSGYSGSVSVEYLFGGSSKKAHYLCGEKGRSPSQGGRIFSGARR